MVKILLSIMAGATGASEDLPKIFSLVSRSSVPKKVAIKIFTFTIDLTSTFVSYSLPFFAGYVEEEADLAYPGNGTCSILPFQYNISLN